MQKKTSFFAGTAAAVLVAILCNALWGSAIPFINLGYDLFAIESSQTASQILFAGLRFFFAGVLTILFASVQQRRFVRPRKENADKVVKLALTQTIAQYVFFFIGVANVTSVKGTIIQGLNAFVAILIVCYLFRTERMNALKWIGGLVGVAGVVLVNLDGSKLDASISLTGEGFLIISMVAGACSAGLIKRYGQREDPVALSGWQFLVGGAAMAACAFALGGRLHPQSIRAYPVLLYLAMISAVAYTLWSVLLRFHPVSRIAVFMFLQPVFGVMLSLLLYGSADVPLLRYGAALVLVCLSIVIVGKGQQEEAA